MAPPQNLRTLVGLGLLAMVSCRGAMGKIEALRDALVQGDRDAAAKVITVPECGEIPLKMPACLDVAARALGAPGFASQKPDQASAAAVAYALAAARRGDGIPETDAWLEAAATAKGPGVDALRLALALGMAEAASKVGLKVEDEPAARAMLAAVAKAIPGTCETYAALGRGEPLSSFPPAASPDHAPCVQRDLTRKEGPGPAYGDGLWRAAAGAAAFWKDAADALAKGALVMEGAPRDALRHKLEVVEAATRAMSVHLVTTSQSTPYSASATDAEAKHGPTDGGAGKPASP
jgi:hypothetical protein